MCFPQQSTKCHLVGVQELIYKLSRKQQPQRMREDPWITAHFFFNRKAVSLGKQIPAKPDQPVAGELTPAVLVALGSGQLGIWAHSTWL